MKDYSKDIDRITDTHIYFWNTIYSQWYARPKLFKDEDGYAYNTAEKYMMMEKALVFEDYDIYRQMKASIFPNDVKALGRRVKGFNDEEWDKHKVDVVTKASYLKFNQNEDLMKIMIEHKDLTLVEASPVDKIWGIGLHFDDDDVLDESKWKGQNLLGVCLMNARKLLFEERGIK